MALQTAPKTEASSARFDRWAVWVLHGPLTLAVILLSLVLLGSWVPHYLTWPWWVDLDDFATQAGSWDAGILPYRDIQGSSFPGQTYLFWILGKAFGWGRTMPIYALDASFVALLGVAMMAWSRRRSGWILPGAVGFLMFLTYYLGLGVALVAQRDWHAPLFVALALMALQAWPGRGSRLASALLMAVAVTFRPHVVVFGPALIAAIDEGARRPGDPWPRSARALLEWGLAFALALVLVFSPLILSGILDEFLGHFGSTLTQVANGEYAEIGSQVEKARHEQANWLWNGIKLLMSTTVLFVPPAIALAAPSCDLTQRRTALTWAVALLGAFAYRLLHPVPHDYLNHPLALVLSLNVADLGALIVTSSVLAAPTARLIAVLLLVAMAMPARPRYAIPNASLRTVRWLALGEKVDAPPPGYYDAAYYPWDDYQNMLEFLRRRISNETRVANVLRGPLAVTGPAGRLSAFRTEFGIPWIWQYNSAWEARYVEQLTQATQSVVVWIPSESASESMPGGELRLLSRAIRDLYEPEAQFGQIEVWRRKPDSKAGVIRIANPQTTGGAPGSVQTR
jgi:hypothetical protein